MSRSIVTGFYPKPQVVNALPEASLKALQNAISSNASLADRHNAFVDYCTAMLFCCTGHRAVREPFSELRHFELDLGLLLICDKVSDDSRAWRLVALPDMAAQQVRMYSAYLRLLASALSAKAPTSGLASQIWMLAEGGTPMPLFFYLRESEDGWDPVTPSALALRWQDRWRIPINLLRHVTANTLLHASQRADWVSIQLGHTDGVDHPLGSTSTSSVLETLAKIRPFLNEGLKSAGWTVVPSPLDGARVRHRPEIPPKTAAAEKSVFGAQRREAERNQKKSTAAQLFRALWQERFPSGSPLDVDAVQQIVEQIVAEAPKRGVSVNWGLQLLYRYLRTRSGGLATLRRVSRVRLIDVEPSPFNADTLESYQATQRARIAFTGYLTEQGKKGAQPDFHVRVAEIVVSAALFGGLANAARLKCLGDVVHGNTYRLHGHEFVDLPLGQGAVFRWFPDQVSQRLIHGLFRTVEPGLAISKTALEKAIKSVINEIGGSAINSPFEWLAKSSRAAAVLEIPGFVASCLSGDVPAVSLPLPQWVRVVTGRALVPDEALPEISDAHLELWSPSTSQARKQRHTEGESRAFLYELRGLISKARHAERAGNLSARKRSKRMLSDLLQKASIDSGWSALPVMLAAWTVHLCKHGTRSKRDLAFATVEKYAVLVSSRLLPVSTHLDVGSLDEVAYEELYLRAVEREKPERRFELACRLSEMHAFWREAYLLEDLDWSAIMAAAGGVAQPGFADANLVTSAEYRRALAVITAEATLGDRRRWQYAGLLIFGFRFGLRFGEALRLAYTDVQRDGECVYVWVHNAVYGEVKSPAGVRVLLLIERLDPLEQQVLERLLKAGEDDFSENPGAMLMADRPGSQDLLDRAEAGRLLNELLRRVTGDRRARFHHLRHGWVTRAVAAQAVLPIPGFSEHLSDKTESELFGDAAGFPLRSIAVAAGHASERTTLGSYTHCVDQLASLYLTVPQLSDHAKAYAEQVASATIRTRRRTARRSSEGRLPPIPEPPISTQLPQAVTIADLQGSLADIRRPSLIDVDMLLRRFRNSGQPIEVIAENLGLDKAASSSILRKARAVEMRTGYDGYRLATQSDDPLALASSSQQVDQYRRETDALSIRLMEIQKRFSVMTASEQTVLVDALAVWVETANAAQWTCDVLQEEQLGAVTYLARFMGAEIVATLPTKTDIESVHMLLRSYGISWNVRGTSQFSGIGLKLSNPGGPNRALWRALMVMAVGLRLDN